MPGDRKHHTDKFRRCVEEVIAKGNSEDSAYAICTTSLQGAGEPIFEGAEMHHLHLLGATGISRTEMLDGREHLVVPVVALMEGVIHAVNAATPEFVPFATLQKAADSWNGRPVVLGHPVKDGKQCSANSPAVWDSHGIGKIFNSRVEGTKLLQEAWIDKAKAKRLHPEMFARLEANTPEEVSVGAWVLTDSVGGDYKGKPFKASWLETTGDHLAFLPGGRGACSMAMGCGAHRAAMHLVTAEAIESDPLELLALKILAAKYEDCPTCNGSGNTDGNPCPTCDGKGEMRTALGARHSGSDVQLIQAVHDHATALGATCDRGNYTMMEAHVPHIELYIGGKRLKEPHFVQTEGGAVGFHIDKQANFKVMATHNVPHTVTGTGTGAAAIVLKAACHCEGDKHMSMTKDKKAELIAALVTDSKYSGFKEGDEPFLETASDERLEDFRSAAAGRKAFDEGHVKLENEQRNLAAKLKVAEERLKGTEEKLVAAQVKPTKDEWLEQAPPEIKALLDQEEKRNTEHRTALVTQLKAAQAEFSEDDLKAMELVMLERLSRTIKVEAPDFSGRGIPAAPRAAGAKDDKLDDYAPPNPYAAGIKALQEKAVN